MSQLKQGTGGAHPVTVALGEARFVSAVRRCSAEGDVAGRVRAQTELAGRWRERGDYRRASVLLALTLTAAEDSFGRGSLTVATVCNEWGVLGKFSGDFDRSVALYRRALGIFESVHGPAHDSVASVCHNIGGLAHARGRHDEGEPWARRAVDIRASLHGPDHPLVAADSAAWAALLDGCGRYDEAEAALRRALDILVSCGSADLDIAVVRHNLAALQHRRGDLTAAVSGYTEVLGLKRQVLGPDHPELATTLVCLAGARAALGDQQQAAEHYRQAQRILTGRVRPEHPVLQVANRRLASLAVSESTPARPL